MLDANNISVISYGYHEPVMPAFWLQNHFNAIKVMIRQVISWRWFDVVQFVFLLSENIHKNVLAYDRKKIKHILPGLEKRYSWRKKSVFILGRKNNILINL